MSLYDTKIFGVDLDCPSCKRAEMTSSKVPVARIIEKLDTFFSKNDLVSAKNLLQYWQKEAELSGDKRGELSIVNEMLGLYRRTNEKEKGQAAVKRATELLSLTGMENKVSGATIMLNAATTSKAFGEPEEAVVFYKKAEKVYLDNLEFSDPLFAALYNNFATTLVDLGQYLKAEELYLLAARLTESHLESLLDCAVTYVNLAHLYENKEGPLSKKIEQCLLKAEELLRSDKVEKNGYYAFVLSKCAPSFDYFGYFALANEFYTLSREIYERS